MSQTKKIDLLADDLARRVGVQRLANRPNASGANQYGEAGLSASDLKKRFDEFPERLRIKINEIINMLGGDEATRYIAINYNGIPVKEGAMLPDNLYDLLMLIANGDFANNFIRINQTGTADSWWLEDIINELHKNVADLTESTGNNRKDIDKIITDTSVTSEATTNGHRVNIKLAGKTVSFEIMNGKDGTKINFVRLGGGMDETVIFYEFPYLPVGAVFYDGDTGGFYRVEALDEDYDGQIKASYLGGKIDLPIAKGSGTNAVVIGNDNNIASGNYSVAEGYNTTASDHYTHSEGYGTKATKGYTHAEGYKTSATAKAAHSEGNQTTASGLHSHSEGYVTTASGGNAHAEGARTVASGDNSHAEGEYTIAKGNYSHAEGRYTEVYGNQSHIEGFSSANASSVVSDLSESTSEDTIKSAWANNKFALVLGNNAHGEGKDNLVLGAFSHAEGRNTIAGSDANSAWYAHAEGKDTKALGNASHAEGLKAEATGAVSHAEGSQTKASGDWSHAEGGLTEARGDYSHASGTGTIAKETAQFVCGAYNADDPTALFIVGASNNPSARANCFSAGHDGSNFCLKIGSTKITEAQLKKLIALI